MANSPFRNFDPESLSTRLAIEQPIAGSHAITDLLRRAAIVCCPLRISNKVITERIMHVKTYDVLGAPRNISFADFHFDQPMQTIEEDATAAQIHAARVLLLLDETLDMVAAIGWTASVADRLLLASAWISDANEKVVDDSKWSALADTIEELERKRDADILESAKNIIRSQSDEGRQHAEKNERNRAQKALKRHAVQLFEEGCREGRWSSVRKAVKDIIPEVQKFSETHNMRKHMFAPTNVERTIYDHLLAHAKTMR